MNKMISFTNSAIKSPLLLHNCKKEERKEGRQEGRKEERKIKGIKSTGVRLYKKYFSEVPVRNENANILVFSYIKNIYIYL